MGQRAEFHYKQAVKRCKPGTENKLLLTPIYMPKFGMTMDAGLIVEWLVAEGDTVAEGDGIVVIETEKVSTEVESPAAGVVVELNCEVDDEVPVGAVIGYIESA